MEKMGMKRARALIFICWLVYTCAYLGRLNYNAGLVEIINVFSSNKASAGTVSSAFFFAYGAGQFVNGFLCKKYNSRIMITLSLVLSSVLNLLMPFGGSIKTMMYLWLLNGAVQSILWSTIVKTLSTHLPPEYLPKAILAMSSSVPVGTFATYGIAALAIGAGKWKLIFFVASVVMTAAAIVWFVIMGRVGKKTVKPQTVAVEETDKTKKRMGFAVLAGAGAIVILAIANGFIKDGLVAWTPTVLHEKFGLNKSISVLLTLFLPLISLSGAIVAAFLYKKTKNVRSPLFIFYVISALSVMLIILSFPLKSIPVTMTLFVLIACCMSAVNNILTSMVPLYYRGKADAGRIAGLINAACYVGSMLSISVLGALADGQGWNAVFKMLLIVSLTAVLFSGLYAVRTFKRKNIQ